MPYKEGFQSGVAQLGIVYELPMIGTDVACLDKVITNNKNGFIVKTGSIDELAEAIIRLKNREIMAKFSSASKVLGETVFSLTEKAKKITNVYDSLFKKG